MIEEFSRYKLTLRQSLPLQEKIRLTLHRIKQWYEYFNGAVYVAFSGGKDSTVLVHLVRSLYHDVPVVFSNTGLEYPEIIEFVHTVDDVLWLKPRKNFIQVIKQYGYPIISKEQSQYIYELRNTKSEKLRNIRLNGNSYGRGKVSKKWLYLVNAPFKISERCCDWLKKDPFKKYEKETGRVSILGTMASESALRMQSYIRFGCNAFNCSKPASRPLSFWTEQDIWQYLKEFNIPYSAIYDKGYDRTGCIYCAYGVHLEKEPNRFQRLKQTHPQLYSYCMDKLGFRDVLTYINVKID